MNQPDLIPDLHSAANGSANGNQPHVILPELLRHAAVTHAPPTDALKTAHETLKRWADLESDGKLQRMNETQLQGEFLANVFGTALGYTLFSEGLPQWHLWPQYGVNGGTADAAIGQFRPDGHEPPRALVELKGPLVDVDRDRSRGRTPVQQCWDYLYAVPGCPWGIVCNYVGFRLYHRDKTPRAFEHFTLQDLRREDAFRRFYLLFGPGGLLPVTRAQEPMADRLLRESGQKQREVGDELYHHYAQQRRELVHRLRQAPYEKPLDAAIRIAQKLIDRIIFVAFCEDRGLVPAHSIDRAWEELPAFTKVTNPRWQNFKSLFHLMNDGHADAGIPPFNGGLFRPDPDVDDLELPDDHIRFFRELGRYDFRDAVNVDVLGHIFERSINDVERLRLTDVLEDEAAAGPRMGKSAERKRGGVYYTPPEFTDFIVRHTVGAALQDRLAEVDRRHGVRRADAERALEPDPKLAAYWRDAFEAVRRVKVCDPACGSGAFLIRAYESFNHAYQTVLGYWAFHDAVAEAREDEVPDLILRENLYGVDLSPEALEITQLALWIRSARRGRTLADLSANIVCGNSLVADAEVDPRALDWRQRFAAVFDRPEGGFDCVIGNPPWERMKLQEREWFDVAAPQIAGAVSAATRRKRIKALEKDDPDLFDRYTAAKEEAERALAHVRASGRFPMTAKGDINTYALFAELARDLLAPTGRVGLLVPSGIATDHTTRAFFADLMESKTLAALYDFENKAPIFPDVHRSYKFSILLLGGLDMTADTADFVFFAHAIEDLADTQRHIPLSGNDIRLLNPNTRTCPIFRSRRDAELTKAIYERVPVLVDESRTEGGNPWGVRFLTMFHQTNDAELFHTAEQLKSEGLKRDGACWQKGRTRFLPLYEAKMVQAYDHRAASVVVDETNWMRQGQTRSTTSVEHQNPEFSASPRWWVAESAVSEAIGEARVQGFVGFKDITSATNQRTMIAAAIPWRAVTNHFPLLLTQAQPRLELCLLANLNSFVFDFVARQKVGGVTLNFFIVRQLPTLGPETYARRCPWDGRRTLETWVSDRVLKLSCTAEDLRPLAEAAGFDPPVHRWREDERAALMAELDAAYFLLYGIGRDDAAYILSTFQGAGDAAPGLLDGLSPAARVLEAYDQLRARSQR